MRRAPDATPSGPEAGLQVDDLDVPFGAGPGLRAVTLAVARGERVALVGPSGAGKTSLLRAAAGLGTTTKGRVLVDGRDVTSLPPERRNVVYMHQRPRLFPHLTVRDNVAFPLEIRGVPRPEARRQAEGLLERVRLGPLASRGASQLSGGQQHRTALARALAANPSVLLLDEPFSALDPELRADVRDAVVALLAERTGPAVVLVTHDVDEACSLADRIAVLMEGGLVQTGLPSDVLTRPRSEAVARFLGVPNVLRGVRDAAGRVSWALGSFAAPGRPGAVVLTLRAGAVQVRPSPHDAHATVVAVLERVTGTMVRVRVNDSEVTGLSAPGASVRAGDGVSLEVTPEAVHVIDDVGPER